MATQRVRRSSNGAGVAAPRGRGAARDSATIAATNDPGAKGVYSAAAHEAFYEGFRAAGLDFAVFLPDSVLDGLEQLLVERGEIATYQCSREDEGVAMAVGAYLIGKRPVVLMEGSGIGFSALILARAIVQRTPMLLIASHNSTLGERYYSHAATRLALEPVLRGLGVPYHVLFDVGQVRTAIVEAQHTVEGQRVPVAVLVPHHVMFETMLR